MLSVYAERKREVLCVLPVMNNAKWDELRLAMYALAPSPAFVTLMVNGHQARPDREWFYHFREGGYGDIIHVDILFDTIDQREAILTALKSIHVPGEEIERGFRVFGYLSEGQAADYL